MADQPIGCLGRYRWWYYKLYFSQKLCYDLITPYVKKSYNDNHFRKVKPLISKLLYLSNKKKEIKQIISS